MYAGTLSPKLQDRPVSTPDIWTPLFPLRLGPSRLFTFRSPIQLWLPPNTRHYDEKYGSSHSFQLLARACQWIVTSQQSISPEYAPPFKHLHPASHPMGDVREGRYPDDSTNQCRPQKSNGNSVDASTTTYTARPIACF